MSDLFENYVAKSGPVECLGQTFPSDDARREHYLQLLSNFLKEPSFRKTEGFPLGSDEDILSLSNPPYYTACPNPFIQDFIQYYGKPYDSKAPYSKEPFAADVSEGRNDPICNAHSYHTKVPPKAVMRYILHYTNPGDLIFDGFAGTGMAGVAAQLCGDRSIVESLGYRVDAAGNIFGETQDEKGVAKWERFSSIGARKSILNDLSPAATFLSYNFNSASDRVLFESKVSKIFDEVKNECAWLYEVIHVDGVSKGQINYALWSDVFNCPECAGEIIFWDVAVDPEASAVKEKFDCPHCSKSLNKKALERVWITKNDPLINSTVKHAKQVPVLINYTVNGKRYDKYPEKSDFDLLEKIENGVIPYWVPIDEVPDGFNTRQPKFSHGITHAHHFFYKRNLWALAACWSRADTPEVRFMFTSMMYKSTQLCAPLMSNYFAALKGQSRGGWVGKERTGTLYCPSIHSEVPIFPQISSRSSSAFVNVGNVENFAVGTSSTSVLAIPGNSLDYVFIDPPFGANINYSEMSFLWEAWLKVRTNNRSEAIENDVQGKGADEYRRIMTTCFKEAYRVLKPGRWMTVEFSNTKASVWNNIQTAISEAGFIIANVSALDKKQGSINAYISTVAVKQDLVISAYKPDGDLENRFVLSGGTEDSVWDFVRTHLNYLLVVKVRDGELEFIAERDPRIIFDRMVAWFIRHNVPVPMSTQEFQSGLTQRFIERDGMMFLPDQVPEYDKKRMEVAVAPQMEMFVSDERSAIDWLTDFLKRRPSTYQEVHTDFLGQLGAGWKKHESKPELGALLEDNFIQYNGTGEVPSQIHSYLSTNYKDLRGLDKNSLVLIAKAKDRWYVPDPNKGQDLEKKREKALLKEFEHYKGFTGRRLKEFRLEALRAGFRASWGAKEYQTIISIANKLPEETLQEDEKLLTLYDLALTRTEADV
jgi:DNA modification methylase